MSDYKPFQNKKILIADDNIMNRKAVKRTMSNYGAIVTEAINGEEAINKVIQETFDIILMDIQMPIIDGIEATKIIREKLNIRTPIFALTGTDSQEQVDLCLSVGMDGYIMKPFTKETLLQPLLNIGHQNKKTVKDQPKTLNSQSHKTYSLEKIKEISNGDTEFVTKMVHLFIQTASSSLEMMKTAYGEKDFKSLNAIAHRIKPSINDLKIHQITDEIKQVELLSKENPDSKLIPEFLIKIENVLNNAINQMKQDYN